MKKNKKIVVIVPTYNEADNIEKTINVLNSNFPKKSNYVFDILVVDSNSPDKTANIVRELIKTHNNLHLLSEKEKSGLGGAYLLGMDYSFNKLSASYVFEFDADLSHDATKIPQFVEYANKGYDLVLGTRYRKGGSIPKDWGLHRKFLSVVGNLFIKTVFLSNKISDWTGGYKLVSKKVYEKVKDKVLLQKGYTFQISLNKEALDAGFKIAEVPFNFTDRVYGNSKLGPEFFLNALYFVLKIRFNDLIKANFFKVCLVGGVGAVIQLTMFRVIRDSVIQFFVGLDNFFIQDRYWAGAEVALLLSIEMAIVSNFILNNLYSFKDRKIKGFFNTVKKFLSFNLTSAGSITIQAVIMGVGLLVFPRTDLTKDLLAILGILVGLIFNFYFYTKFIWKKTK